MNAKLPIDGVLAVASHPVELLINPNEDDEQPRWYVLDERDLME